MNVLRLGVKLIQKTPVHPRKGGEHVILIRFNKLIVYLDNVLMSLKRPRNVD
jgi:hypothetical protein